MSVSIQTMMSPDPVTVGIVTIGVIAIVGIVGIVALGAMATGTNLGVTATDSEGNSAEVEVEQVPNEKSKK